MADGIDFDAFPRFSLCHRPTPIEPLPRLGERLGGPRLFVKRDDCTGLAFGGNKTRKLEFLLGEALARGADTLVTQGAVQSNHVRQTAAAACRAGLACHALLERRVADPGPDYEDSGNVLLDRLFGATLEYRPAGLDMNAEGEAVAEALGRRGRRPYFVPGGGSCPTGALGYALCAAEILDQSRRSGIVFDWIVLATGSSGTQAGLVAGLHALGSDLPVIGISVSRPQEVQTALVHDLARRTATERLGSPPPPAARILVDDGHVGPGYGVPAADTLEALELAARLEGLLLDPVYTGKGMAGLIALVRRGFFAPESNVLFLHTGGAPALFAYADRLRHAGEGAAGTAFTSDRQGKGEPA